MSKPPLAGFTLIEVLVSIAILAAVAAVAIPNFRRFSEDQSIKNTTANVVSALRTAQANAQTGVTCPDGTTAINWAIVLNSNYYTLQPTCYNISTGNQYVASLPSVSYPSSITMVSPNGSSCAISFTQTTVSGSNTAGCFSGSIGITLDDPNTNPPKRQINIDKGGAITCQVEQTDGTVVANPC